LKKRDLEAKDKIEKKPSSQNLVCFNETPSFTVPDPKESSEKKGFNNLKEGLASRASQVSFDNDGEPKEKK
jgi:hypothetical protein